MLKLLIFVLLVAAVIYAFTRRSGTDWPPRDPPPDPDPDPVWPAGRIGRDRPTTPEKEPAGEINEMITGETGDADD